MAQQQELYHCSKCGRDLPADEFYWLKCRKAPLNWCKSCRSVYHKQRIRSPVISDRLREQRRLAARRYRATPHGRKAHNQRTRNHIQAHPEQKRAKAALYRAIQRGEVARQPCERCGATVGVQAHHEDYSRPLDVHWLCPSCHAQITQRKVG